MSKDREKELNGMICMKYNMTYPCDVKIDNVSKKLRINPGLVKN